MCQVKTGIVKLPHETTLAMYQQIYALHSYLILFFGMLNPGDLIQ